MFDDCPPVWVRIFHNNSDDPKPSLHASGHRVTEVFAYAARPGSRDSDYELTEEALNLFNDDPRSFSSDPRVVDYNARGNRALFPGDVVSVDGRFYICGSLEWRAMADAPVVERRAAPGTVPLR
ncbi:hypothetical protein [Amycolatopsis sp. NPDC004079]|uniref:hypothetical protein n=1 Tax=Amycolatopsis sp. NPDC004079 TaxID=3154549 RepID=UPI0033AF5F5E